jgi:hypothetical protein
LLISGDGHRVSVGFHLPRKSCPPRVVPERNERVLRIIGGSDQILLFLRALQFQLEPECTAHTLGALDANFSAHQFDDLFADRKTQTRAANICYLVTNKGLAYFG